MGKAVSLRPLRFVYRMHLGSGKTFTMGNEFKLDVEPEHRGISPRVMEDIFQRIRHADDQENQFIVKLSYLEVRPRRRTP